MSDRGEGAVGGGGGEELARDVGGRGGGETEQKGGAGLPAGDVEEGGGEDRQHLEGGGAAVSTVASLTSPQVEESHTPPLFPTPLETE